MPVDPEKPPRVGANPYLCGVFLGVTLLVSFVVLGAGLGASGGLARMAAFVEVSLAPAHTLSSPYFGRWGNAPLDYYLTFMLLGTFLGALISSVAGSSGRIMIERGRAASPRSRLVFASVGGVIVGFASRLAQGCSSGQALTGGALLLSGSLVFLVCIFAAGYATAYLVRRQWHD
jgi:hypothetical protein